MTQSPQQAGRAELKRTLHLFRREFLVVGVFSVVANLMLLTPTLYMLQVYDRVMVSQSALTLVAVSLIALFFFGMMAFAEWCRSRLLVRIGIRLDGILGTRVFNASFDAYLTQSGRNPSRAFSDLVELRQFMTGQGVFALFDLPWTPIYIGVQFLLHPMLGLLGIAFALVQLAVAWYGHRRTLAPEHEVGEAQADANAFLNSKLRNAEVLEAMGMVENLRQSWTRRNLRALERAHAAQGLSSRILSWTKFIRYTQQSLALAAGALLAIDGKLTAGGIIASNALMRQALQPIETVVTSWRSFLRAREAFHRLSALLESHPEREATPTPAPPAGEITLRGLTATAVGRESPILDGVDLDLQPGTLTVVLGPSGSGKSTLARVVVGIWPQCAGEALLDGRPIASWNRIDLGPHIGYLPQDVELFEGTIAENIARFGAVDSPKVIAAAQAAGLHEMILRFPRGYDTAIGEAGSALSAGQRQRIGLARALYGGPRLVVLDEPNANLDDAGEAALVRAVQHLRDQGRTVLLITHRGGIVAAADRLLVLRAGAVQHHGPRDAVLARLQAAQRAATAPSTSAPPPGGASPRPV